MCCLLIFLNAATARLTGELLWLGKDHVDLAILLGLCGRLAGPCARDDIVKHW